MKWRKLWEKVHWTKSSTCSICKRKFTKNDRIINDFLVRRRYHLQCPEGL